jgi:uridine phosphorylase
MHRIAESELILNSRGAVYHLDLLPEEIADTIITVGDPDRVALVSKHFDSIELCRNQREFITHTGYVGKKRLTVISTGIGPDNIDIVLNELDALVNIDLNSRVPNPETRSLRIVRVGTAGSLQADIPVDSWVASTHAIGIDNLMNFYQHEQTEEDKLILQHFVTHTQLNSQISRPYIKGAAASLMRLFVDKFAHGITVTCPGFYAPQGRILRFGLAMPGFIDKLSGFTFGQHRICNFEMETSAIYGLGKLLGHHCISLSAIVANRVTKQYSADSSATVNRLITHVIETLSAEG